MQADSLSAEPPGESKNPGVGSLDLLQGIFLTQGLNQGLLHCRWILYQLSCQGSSNQGTSIYLSIYLSIHLSVIYIYVSIYRLYLSMYLSIYLSFIYIYHLSIIYVPNLCGEGSVGPFPEAVSSPGSEERGKESQRRGRGLMTPLSWAVGVGGPDPRSSPSRNPGTP